MPDTPDPRLPRRQIAPVAVALLTFVLLSMQAAWPRPARAADAAFADPLRTDAALATRTAGLPSPDDPDCAQRRPGERLALGDAVDIALCRNPQTRAAWAGARQQAAALGLARSAWLPTLDASGSVNWADGRRSGVTSAGSRRTTDAALDLSWTLYDFGGRSARNASARSLLDAAAANVSDVAQQVVYDAVQSYYDVVAQAAAVAAARQAEEAAARSLEVARARLQVGVATRADLLQTQTAYDQSVLDRVQAEGALASARGQLAVALGEPVDRTLELAPEPVPEEVPALQTRVADLLADAERQRPDLAAARAQRESAAAEVTVARATGRPRISVGASRSYSDSAGFPSQDLHSVGVSVSVPIYTGFDTRYRVRQAQAAYQARDADAERIRRQVSLDVWNAYAGLGTAGQRLQASAALLASAGENERVALGRYQAGVGTIVDVLTAQSSAAAARRQRIDAERSWQVARAQLALATGRLASAAPLATPGATP